MNNLQIKSILVDGQGYIYANEEMPITEVLKNGEMANVIGYQFGNQEFNSKYVIKVEYYETIQPVK